ncbi:MAG: hypothetical protein HPZ79_05260 [Oscillospiraceae bacterium]|nr:hypothetical protein [Oscillospiraceae bacterium]
MKKALLCILSLSMLLSVLTACSKENGMVTDTTPPTVTDPVTDHNQNDGNILDDVLPDETAPVTQSPVPDANPKGGNENTVTP